MMTMKLYKAFCLLVLMTMTTMSPTFVMADRTAAGAALSKALKQMDMRYFIAGGTCAAISHGATTPIDVVKTRIQADPEKYCNGMLDAAKQIVKASGPGALLCGLGPTVVGYALEGAMKFGTYELAKPVMMSIFGNDKKGLAYTLASLIAGSVAAVFLCPMESLRIKQVTDPQYENDTLMSGLPKLVSQEGFASLFGGVWAMLAKQVPYTFGKQVSFDVIAATLYHVLAHINRWVVSVTAAFCASIVACLCSQPGDMILTETYKTTSPASSSSSDKKKKKKKTSGDKATKQQQLQIQQRSFVQILQELYQRGGCQEFFRGTQARMVHVGMIITSQLIIYDMVKQLLGLPATGSH